MKGRKVSFIVLMISILIIIVGYFLWAILFPVQDLNMMSQEDIWALQKEVALNYELGKGMMWTGICGICVSIFLLFLQRK